MATRLSYRNNLKNKLLALEDGSYGDFEYADAELDTYLDLSVARLFPAVYFRNSVEDLTLTGYGSAQLGYVSDDSIAYDTVYMLEDALELDTVVGWEVRGTKIVGVDTSLFTTINVYWIEPYTLPLDELDETLIPVVYEPLINLGALIEALEARQDTGVRGEPAPTGVFQETQLLDRLRPRYDALKGELSMALPGMRF